MKTSLSAAHINPDLFAVEMHGKVYVDGAVLSSTGRVTGTVDKAGLQAMADMIQAALNGFAPTPGRPKPVEADIVMANGSTITFVDDFNPEDLA